jgi:hypothetical protein
LPQGQPSRRHGGRSPVLNHANDSPPAGGSASSAHIPAVIPNRIAPDPG